MKFYDREKELAQIKSSTLLSRQSSQMTIVTGRRRVGKTRLLLQSMKKTPFLYFFIARKNEHLLCEEFTEEIQNRLGIKIFGKIDHFKDLFEYLMEQSRQKHFTLIIDEFQEFKHINPSVFSDIQKIWDTKKDETHLHVVFCGSIYSMMKEIFEDTKEPLFGRANLNINLKPFDVNTLEKIYNEYSPSKNKRNFLEFFTITGGVPKYVEYFVDREILTLDQMLDAIFQENSIFINEGKNVLIEEFGKDYSTYFSVLSLIAASKTSRSELESILEKNLGGFLDRLEKDFGIIKKVKPILSKPQGRIQKYYIEDNFLNFWFRFIYKHFNAIEIGNYNYLKKIVKRDFASFSGRFLEKYFKEKLALTGRYNTIGNYWERGNQNEIDIVAVDDFNKVLLVAEVKLNRGKASLKRLQKKTSTLNKKFGGYKIQYQIFSIENIFEKI